MKIATPEAYQGNYHRFDINMKADKEQHFFICSDVHIDNPKTRQDLFFKHMDEAKEKDAFIFITGDLMCLMQGKYDPRSNKSALRPEHMADNYLDAVINDTAEKLAPYAKNILLISRGNHETSVSGRAETDIMGRLVERMNLKNGVNIQVGEYTGYYTLCFHRDGANSKALNIGYSHGNWGGIISKGTQSVVRYAAVMPDCDIFFSGHTHDGWIVTQPRLKRNIHKKAVEVVNQWHVKTGTYKEEFAKGRGWAAERIGMPKYLGGCFMRVNYSQKKDLDFTLMLTP